MKSTGIVKKIDNLGRIVIPKEIRKKLCIRDFSDMEICMDDDCIILKKYSSMCGIDLLMSSFVNILYSDLKKNILLTDLNHVICCNNNVINRYFEKEISKSYLDLISRRESLFSSDLLNLEVIDGDTEKKYYMIEPVIVNGELLGSILMYSDKDEISESDKKILKMIVKFLKNNLED